MNKKDVREFFDSLADSWDDNMIKSQWKIDKIFDISEVTPGKKILDVACGTGVLIPDYINRRVSKCVAVDISEKMTEIAKSKFGKYKNIEFLCADAEYEKFEDEFDCVIIYNAFPHFINPVKLFENLSECLKQGGRITIAHGMSREALIRHHSGSAEKFSTILPEADSLAEMMSTYFEIDTRISDDELYIVSGKKIDM